MELDITLEEVSIPNWPFQLLGIAYGQGERLQLEVLCSEHNQIPNLTQLRSAWKVRQNRRGVPLLVIVLHDGKAHVCGPSGEDPTVYPNLDPGQVERICQEALEKTTRTAVLRVLRDNLGTLEEGAFPGLRNEGLLAFHELASGVPKRSEWNRARDKACAVLNDTGDELLLSLGFAIEPLDNVVKVLRSETHKSALGILLEEQETPESGSERIPGNLSPVSYALVLADEENLDWVILIHGRKIRLYPTKMGVGVGRRGRSETFIECHTGLISDDQAAYLWLLFSAEALSPGGTLESILEDSKIFSGDLADQLRERIYDEVIPLLAKGLVEARNLKKPSAHELAETYQMAMHILFRLLFIAYGEDKDLLPYRFNGLYQKRSLKAKARELQDIDQFDESDSWWQEVQSIFKAVEKGNKEWGVPAYNGGLFSSDPTESKIGVALSAVSLPNRILGPALQQLLLVPTSEGVIGPVDFRSLSVREFGTIYEGLLESELSVAETDLTVETRGKNKDAYRPCRENEKPIVSKGTIYLHNASGARKSTGSYYTQSFAVEHLLDRSLEPALDSHFTRLDKLEALEAAESFFDFRVADIAMGSGHFLIAAIDRMEARFSGYLKKRAEQGDPLNHVILELNSLRKASVDALGDAADSYPDLEDNALLRRLIARRCIYGVDINEVAVQLARLAAWIHTFVPGLPLSLLDRNLVHGNSLVGIGQLDEFHEVFRDSSMPLFQMDSDVFLGDASEALARMGKISDATKTELQQARKAWQEADAAIAPTHALCDILTASRIEGEEFPIILADWESQKQSVVDSPDHDHARSVLKGMKPLHFPIAFPEVFLRERAGFDVILGNPPWEKARVETHGFWARHFPGLRGLSQREREKLYEDLRSSRPDLQRALDDEVRVTTSLRAALLRGPFPGMGTGDPDLYKAFCWRFWFLVAEEGGCIGVVLPRSALAAKGSEEFRWRLFREANLIDATVLTNTARWIFDMEPRYTVALVGIQRSSSLNSRLKLSGPYNNRTAYDARTEKDVATFTGSEALAWNDSALLPLLPTRKSFEIFIQLRKAPRLDLNIENQWRARPYREFETYMKDKMLFIESPPEGYWPIMAGRSFDLWNPFLGPEYAWIDPQVAMDHYQAKRVKGSRTKSSVFSKCSAKWISDVNTLPCLNPRIAFRDIARATDSRTVRCALIPGQSICVETSPVFLFPRGERRDEAYLLGVLSSLSLDWYARRFVEIHLKVHVINPFPIPRPGPDNSFRQRIIELAGRLACPDERFADWAREVGVECGPLDNNEKQDMIHELDAVVAHLYGLTRDHLTHIFETFHVGWDYQARLDATLEHFAKWESKK